MWRQFVRNSFKNTDFMGFEPFFFDIRTPERIFNKLKGLFKLDIDLFVF